MAPVPMTPNQRYAAYLAMVLGALATLVTAYHFYTKGFSWEVSLVFNWHPVLMIAAWMGASTYAALAYRVLPVSHETAKAAHGALHVLTLVLWSIALAAVLKSHNDATPPIQNFYSLHSWFGLATVGLFSLNFIAGFGAFVFPGAKQETRAALVPRHALLGSLATALLAGVTVQLGVLEYLTFQGLSKTDKLDSQQYLLHFVAFISLLTSAITFAILRHLQVNPAPAPSDTVEVQGHEPLLQTHT